jgi:membrane protein YdbS with pleckstrin-like domain
LIFIELFWAFLTTWLSIEIDFPQLFEELQLDRVASFTIIVTLVVTSLQIFIVAVAFITWYFDAYKVDRRKITHQRGNFFGVSDVAPTQALTDVKVHQSRLGRTFNYGNLELVSVDSSRQAFLKNIPNPNHYAALIKALIPPQQMDVNLQLQKSIPATIAEGEGQYVEFKSSFSWDYRQQRVNKDLNKAVLKNVVAFMNTTGGVILIGVGDEGEILGLEPEFQSMKKPNPDGFENLFNMAFNKMVGVQFSDYVSVDFELIEGKTVCRILTLPGSEPVYLTYGNKEEFYIRTGNSSQPLTISQAVNYIQRHFDH